MKMNRSASYDVVVGIEEGGVGSNTAAATNNNNNSWVLWTSQPIDSGGSGIPKFWGASMVREDKEKGKVKEFEGRTFFDCEVWFSVFSFGSDEEKKIGVGVCCTVGVGF